MCHLRTVLLIVTSLVGFSVGIGTEEFANNDDDGRIIGGEPADIKDIPYQLSLRYIPNKQHFCGASIISTDWAVSAAHCFEDTKIDTVALIAGATLQTQKGSVHRIAKVIIHPSFNSITLNEDVAAIQVRNPFPLGLPGIQCIALASEGPKKGNLAQVSGWGKTEKEVYTNELFKVRVPIISNADCGKMYSEGQITDLMICAGYSSGGKDSCVGDSGGPLVINNKLAGIVSWGVGCAQPNRPGVYTRVDALRNWIISVTNVPECTA